MSDGEIPAKMVLSIISFSIPAMGLLMLPLSLYIGILLTFGRLYAESEITVMNATGIGNAFLMRAALYLAVITASVAAFNSFWLAPWSADKEAQLMEQLASENNVDLVKKGSFHRTPDGSSVIFIDEIQEKKLKNVFIAQIRPKNSTLPSILFSNSGDIKITSDGRQVITMYQGRRYEGVPTRVDYRITKFDEYEGVIGQRGTKRKGRAWEAIPTLELLSNPVAQARAELQWRISLVLSIPLLTILVVPLATVNSRQGRFGKIGPAILVYLAYFLSISAIKSAIEDSSIFSFIGMWPVNIILFIAAVGINILDSTPVRKFKDKIRYKRIAN
ncbi:lipopolysaccharide export system permease protein lptF [Candidatus Photodesmus blepharus]|uniref:Lipopolysaccharide export system permease protein LptF n=1 Tax=Candidatus Photodesmus blepharonis TaxID=1179155 RepID=A0A084CM10_9GAMM|nr:lipopolysaccharide export system permease protein lptF [Candidatus Photodesmus blepharus]